MRTVKKTILFFLHEQDISYFAPLLDKPKKVDNLRIVPMPSGEKVKIPDDVKIIAIIPVFILTCRCTNFQNAKKDIALLETPGRKNKNVFLLVRLVCQFAIM